MVIAMREVPGQLIQNPEDEDKPAVALLEYVCPTCGKGFPTYGGNDGKLRLTAPDQCGRCGSPLDQKEGKKYADSQAKLSPAVPGMSSGEKNAADAVAMARAIIISEDRVNAALARVTVAEKALADVQAVGEAQA